MTNRLPIYFNGKFYSGPMNGVHRVADRLIREIDAQLAARPSGLRGRVELLAPDSSSWLPKLSAISARTYKKTNQLWEQIVLPWLTRDGVLVNLANVAPVLHPRKLTMIHDVQFLLPDCGYSLRQRLGYRVLAPSIGHSSRRVLTVSEFSRRMLSEHGISTRDAIVVIPNGADHIKHVAARPELVAQFGLVGRDYVVMFASPKPYKNARIVFEAFRKNVLSDVRLVLVGSSRATLERSGLLVPPNATFAGPVDDGGLKGLLQNALAIAFPSRTEGFGLPPLEAMLCDCPVIASRGGAIPEVCGDAVIYADQDDAEQWANAVQSLRQDALLRRKLILAGREQAAIFTWQAAGRKLADAIEVAAA